MKILQCRLNVEECRNKLQTQGHEDGSVSLFAREIHYPDVLIRVDGDSLSVEQRKSYFNPWARLFRARLIEAGPSMTLIKGQFSERPLVKIMTRAYHFLIACAFAAFADTTRHLLSSSALTSGWKMYYSLAAALLLILTLASIGSVKWCEKRYRRLSEYEPKFILESLQSALLAKPIASPSLLMNSREDIFSQAA